MCVFPHDYRTCCSMRWLSGTHMGAPNRQFILAHFVVHMPSCLHDLFCVGRPLHGNRGCEGTVTWGARIP